MRLLVLFVLIQKRAISITEGSQLTFVHLQLNEYVFEVSEIHRVKIEGDNEVTPTVKLKSERGLQQQGTVNLSVPATVTYYCFVLKLFEDECTVTHSSCHIYKSQGASSTSVRSHYIVCVIDTVVSEERANREDVMYIENKCWRREEGGDCFFDRWPHLHDSHWQTEYRMRAAGAALYCRCVLKGYSSALQRLMPFLSSSFQVRSRKFPWAAQKRRPRWRSSWTWTSFLNRLETGKTSSTDHNACDPKSQTAPYSVLYQTDWV